MKLTVFFAAMFCFLGPTISLYADELPDKEALSNNNWSSFDGISSVFPTVQKEAISAATENRVEYPDTPGTFADFAAKRIVAWSPKDNSYSVLYLVSEPSSGPNRNVTCELLHKRLEKAFGEPKTYYNYTQPEMSLSENTRFSDEGVWRIGTSAISAKCMGAIFPTQTLTTAIVLFTESSRIATPVERVYLGCIGTQTSTGVLHNDPPIENVKTYIRVDEQTNTLVVNQHFFKDDVQLGEQRIVARKTAFDDKTKMQKIFSIDIDRVLGIYKFDLQLQSTDGQNAGVTIRGSCKKVNSAPRAF